MTSNATCIGECGWFVKGVETTKPSDAEGLRQWDRADHGALVLWPREGSGLLDWGSFGVPSNMSPWMSWASSVHSAVVRDGVRAAGTLRGFLAGCSQLTACDLDGLDARDVQDVGLFFKGCNVLSSVDLRFLAESELERVDGMFLGCAFLESADARFDSTEIVDASEMFSGCAQLRRFSSQWELPRVRTVLGMFNDCTALESLELPNATFDRCENFACFLRGAAKVRTVDLRSANLARARDLWAMFAGCEGLREVRVGKGWEIPGAARTVAMHDGTSPVYEVEGQEG